MIKLYKYNQINSVNNDNILREKGNGIFMSNNNNSKKEVSKTFGKTTIKLVYDVDKLGNEYPNINDSKIIYDNNDFSQLLLKLTEKLQKKEILVKDYQNKINEICFEYCEATYEFSNRDYRIRAQHLLFEKISRISVEESLSNIITSKINLHKLILKNVIEWEKSNESKYNEGVQKGTGYYWVAENYLDQEHIIKGFHYFIQAIEEDKKFDLQKSEYHKQGGYLSASLADKLTIGKKTITPRSKEIKEIINDLKSIVSSYQSKYGSSFSYEKLKKHFLIKPALEEFKFGFTSTFAQLYDYFTNYDEYLFDNFQIFPTILSNLFDLMVVFERLIKNKDDYRTGSLAKNVFKIICDRLVTQPQHQIFCIEVNSKTQLHKDINDTYKNELIISDPRYMTDIISLSFSSNGNKVPPLPSVLISAYLLRNLGAHELGYVKWSITALKLDKTIIKEMFINICHAIILIIELLY